MDPDDEVFPEDEVFTAALCAVDRTPIIQFPEGWRHLERPDDHTPKPLPGTAAPANVWDCDEAAARLLGNA